MRKFRSHKVVEAGLIEAFGQAEDGTTLIATGTEQIPVPGNFFARGTPHIGDYLVRYEDGYLSWSPRKVFDEGYTAVE